MLAGGGAGGVLVAHGADHVRGRTDELDLAALADLREAGVLGEESVAGVNGVGLGDFGCRDDAVGLEIAVAAGPRTDAHRLVGKLHVQRIDIGLGVDRHGLHSQFAAGADHPEGDFASVGNEDFREHRRWVGGSDYREGAKRHDRTNRRYLSRKRMSPNWTGVESSTLTSAIVPLISALISFMTFMASMMHRVCPSLTGSPTLTKGSASGVGLR